MGITNTTLQQDSLGLSISNKTIGNCIFTRSHYQLGTELFLTLYCFLQIFKTRPHQQRFVHKYETLPIFPSTITPVPILFVMLLFSSNCCANELAEIKSKMKMVEVILFLVFFNE